MWPVTCPDHVINLHGFINLVTFLFCFVFLKEGEERFMLGSQDNQEKDRNLEGQHGALLRPGLRGWINRKGRTPEGEGGLFRVGVHTECFKAQVMK